MGDIPPAGGTDLRRWRHVFALGAGAVAGLALASYLSLAYFFRPAAVPPAPAQVLRRVPYNYQPVLGYEQIDLTAEWRFHLDREDAGVKSGWASASFDDTGWDTITTGQYWEDQGYPDYDGLGWYRKQVVAPASWQGKPVYLHFSADDECDVYVNGQPVGHWGDRAAEKTVASQRLSVEVTQFLRPGQSNTIAIRINDWHGGGGIPNQPVLLSTSATELADERQYLIKLAAHNWGIWPSWAVGGDKAWTTTGLPQSGTTAILGLDATLSPNQSSFSTSVWVLDREAKHLIAPENLPVEHHLQDGYQPSPSAVWRDGDLLAEASVIVTDEAPLPGRKEQLRWLLGFAPKSPAEPVVIESVTLTNQGSAPKEYVAVIAIRPVAPNGTVRRVQTVAGSGDTVRVNGQVALVADQPPAGFGAASLAGTDLPRYIAEGTLPAITRFEDPQGLATIGLEYPLTLAPGESRTLTFKLPQNNQPAAGGQQAPESERLARMRELRFEVESSRLRAQWQARLQRVSIILPDQRYTDAFYASLGYMLLNMDGSTIMSGPFAHHAMWYRDVAYIGPALLRAGLGDYLPAALDILTAGQLPTGEFPAALEANGQSRFFERHEWDAQGQYIYAQATYYRFTGDRQRLAAAYPTVKRAADFAIDLSKQVRRPELLGTPLYGILPPGDSAEDLGPREWHHYWDDFWVVGGLREAAFIARTLGKEADATNYEREAADLLRLTNESIAVVQKANGIDYIPNGPEDPTGSSMARGTTPAVWPLGLYARDDALILRSFERYHELWVVPHGNAYLHNSGNDWPYGGMGLAHAYMNLWQAGRGSGMMKWVIDNQTLPGTYAWGEGVTPQTHRFAGGDMPHSWAAAEYISYLRDALIHEDGNRLVIADGVPAFWLQPGQQVEIHGAPTWFGKAGFTLVSHHDQGYWDLAIDESTSAPGGYLLRGPFPKPPKRVVVDGVETTLSGEPFIDLPASAHAVRIYFD